MEAGRPLAELSLEDINDHKEFARIEAVISMENGEHFPYSRKIDKYGKKTHNKKHIILFIIS